MATHCSILVWRIPWEEKTGGLQSVGSQSYRLPTTVFLCGESHGKRRQAGYSLWDKKWLSNWHFAFLFCFVFSFIFISWRLITSQHFSGFCHTLTWISHGVTCIPHPDPPSHLLSTRFLWVFPVHQARALVSYIPPGLVIWFTIDNIQAILSKHPTITFSHRVQKSVLYICVYFSVLHIGLSLPSF